MTMKSKGTTGLETPLKWWVDPIQPGIVRFNNDRMTGILVGLHSKYVAEACNSYPSLLTERDRLREVLQMVASKVTDEGKRAIKHTGELGLYFSIKELETIEAAIKLAEGGE